MKFSTLAVVAGIAAVGFVAHRFLTGSESLEVATPEEALPETPVLLLPAPTTVETQAE
jgi:hypothetical protein